ncbi:response regulator transcription factor [Sporosarcina oncorhynchi]|uniref:Response regulator transcription factor n=1 Tax=Sporosarcina oncorhynchi TaxID=3056444 RepID=A0ABZ0L7B7_9BACL|nr:response regulator transcription factor [Sporosarcina sp. T2O-4]WOV88064.1 response regulator transcription factor [Sporosarcina sp. T2O-4]
MKILLANDQTLIRKGLIFTLSAPGELEVVGEAVNKRESLHLLQTVKPDLFIIDFKLGHESGLEIIAEAKQYNGHCKFAILTNSQDLMLFEQARVLGVDAFISLQALPEEFIYALYMIQRGRKYYDPDMIDLLIQSQRESFVDKSPLEQLTLKEKEVLGKLGLGFSNKQIAHNLFITEHTVKKHVSQILSKLSLGDRTHAALYANETGLVQYRVDVLV